MQTVTVLVNIIGTVGIIKDKTRNSSKVETWNVLQRRNSYDELEKKS